MPNRALCALLFAATPPLLLAACGGEDDPLAAPPAAVAAADSAQDSLSMDLVYGATAVENLQVTPVTLDVAGLPEGWEGMRIAMLSDLRLGLWPDNRGVAEAAVRQALRHDPDLVVLLGDYLSGEQYADELREVLMPLRDQLTLAVLGDQDIATDSLAALTTRTLESLGIEVLRNEATLMRFGGSIAQVGGVDPELLYEPEGTQAWVLTSVGGVDGYVPLLLTHSPVLATRAPEERFSAIFAGGTFCGDVEVPGALRRSWLEREAFPGAVIPGVERLYRVQDSLLFVTCGLGYSFVPMRAGAPPEVALVTLHRVEGGGTPADPAGPAPDTLGADSLLQRNQGAGGSDTTPG